MHAFLSWSKAQSKAVALALREWLPNLFESIECFMSKVDIDAGRSWDEAIAQSLNKCSVGILCVNTENYKEPWILFEAGAVAKEVGGNKSRVIPYLVGLEPKHLIGSPLHRLQAVAADKEGTWEMVQSLHREYVKDHPQRDEVRLKAAFDLWWPDLEQRLVEAQRVQTPPAPQPRPQEEILAHLVSLVENLANSQDSLQRAMRTLEGRAVSRGSITGGSSEGTVQVIDFATLAAERAGRGMTGPFLVAPGATLGPAAGSFGASGPYVVPASPDEPGAGAGPTGMTGPAPRRT
jgi:hypothetical protein